MMNLGIHANFIIASYGMAVLVVTALMIWVVADHRAQQRILRRLEERGITRRSGGASRSGGETRRSGPPRDDAT